MVHLLRVNLAQDSGDRKCAFAKVSWNPRASQVALVVKKPPANAGDIRDMGSIPGSGRSPGEGHATYSSILAWRIPWTEEAGELQSMGSQSQTRLKCLSPHACLL